MTAPDDLIAAADAPRCGHHNEVMLTDVPDVGLRCPWCFPEHFPEHRFLVKFDEAERFLAAAGYDVVTRPPDTPADSKWPTPDDARRMGQDAARSVGPPDDVTARARRLLAAATPGPLAYDECFVLDGTTGDVLFECDSEQTAALIAAAPTLIADLAAEVERRLRGERVNAVAYNAAARLIDREGWK